VTDASVNSRLRELWLRPSATGAGYYLGAELGVAASAMSEGIAIFWLPNGILLAALLMAPRRLWPAHLAAAVLAEIAADLPTFTLVQALGFAAVNLVECLLAAYLLERVARPFALDRLRHVVAFGVYALVVACGVAALIGASVYALSTETATSFWTFWRVWWLGDGLGVLLVTPLLLGWLRGRPHEGGGRAVEAVALIVLAALVSFWVFYAAPEAASGVPRRPFLLLPLSLWAAVRFGVRGAASVGLVIAAVAIAATLHDVGPLVAVASSPGDQVLLLQEYLAVQILPAIALAALLQELRDGNTRLRAREVELQRTHDELDDLNRELEARVQARTEALEIANARLEVLASIDPLTGISNRRHFVQLAHAEISRAKRQHLPLSVIMFDIDFFKAINDSFGHEAGDKTLVAIASALTSHLRAGDVFARLGGEEFILMLPGQGIKDALQTAERLRLVVAQLHVDGCDAEVTVSAGVTSLESEAEEIDDLLRRADRALYLAKRQGRNRVCASPLAGSDAA
jgi:diguanylate cyclase (GGDEF)-like protein